MPRNFYVRTCVKFTFANKIEAMHEMFARKGKTWTSLNFSFKLSTFYRASILFTWLKFTCFNVRSQTRVSGNQPLGWAVRFQHVNAVRTSLCQRNSLGVKVILVSYKQPLKETTGVGGPKLRINYHLMRYWACLFAQLGNTLSSALCLTASHVNKSAKALSDDNLRIVVDVRPFSYSKEVRWHIMRTQRRSWWIGHHIKTALDLSCQYYWELSSPSFVLHDTSDCRQQSFKANIYRKLLNLLPLQARFAFSSFCSLSFQTCDWISYSRSYQ